MLRQSTISQQFQNNQNRQQKQQLITPIVKNPCVKPIHRKLKRYQNISLIYLNKNAFFYPHCNKKLKLFGNSNISTENQENKPLIQENKFQKPKIPPLKLEFQRSNNFFKNFQKQNTERIYDKLSHRSILNLLNELNYSRNTPRPQSVSNNSL